MNIKQATLMGVIAVSVFGAAGTVQAAEGSLFAALGAGVSSSADYEGSNDYKTDGMPFLSIGWRSNTAVPSDGTGL